MDGEQPALRLSAQQSLRLLRRLAKVRRYGFVLLVVPAKLEIRTMIF
jgi:hypothetical protein